MKIPLKLTVKRNKIVKHSVYIVIGIDMKEHKDIMGMYVGQIVVIPLA